MTNGSDDIKNVGLSPPSAPPKLVAIANLPSLTALSCSCVRSFDSAFGKSLMTTRPLVFCFTASAKAASASLVLSGADVELESFIRTQGKTVAIDNLNPGLPSNAVAIFAQITPEPGPDLRNASERLRNVARKRYLEYSKTLSDDVALELLRSVEGQKAVSLEAKSFGDFAKAAHEKQMMAFLPRLLTPSSSLPARQSYAAQSDWYTVRLWVALDGLILKESSQ